jgi:Fur family ferric uptake transcriptional regulator
VTTRNTKHKQHVIALLSVTGPALSADEVLDRLEDAPNRVTVYRILDRLEREGIAHRVVGINGTAYYSLCETQCGGHGHQHNHAHFQCRKCMEVSCLEIEPALPKHGAYLIEDQQVLLIGLCTTCK